MACLVASALAAYLVLRRTQADDSPWVLFPLAAALAPVVLVGAIVVAITLPTLLSALVEDWTGGVQRSVRAPSTDRAHEQPHNHRRR